MHCLSNRRYHHILRYTVVVNFDPKKGQAPEGLAVSNKDVFVAWSPIGQVAKINKDNLTVSKYRSWPTIPPNEGSMLGLNFDKQGNLYAACIFPFA